MKKSWLVGIAALLSQCAIHAHSFESFVVKNIRIEGLQRITEGTVLNYLPVRVGEELPASKTSEILKSLFETGFFQDIQLEKDGNVLVIKVVERPTIGKITVTGNKEIKTENLTSTLKTAGLAEGHVFDRSTFEQIRNELERLYFSHGKYAVKVESTVEQQKHNRVNVSINIDEGHPARIKAINIVGNKRFSTAELLKKFNLAPTHAFSWVMSSDQYDKQKLSADLEELRNFYFDRGYLTFRIISTQVSITPDKQDIYITINIEEGEQFILSGFQLAGDTIVPESELLPLVKLKTGEVFSRAKIADATKALSDRLGEEGYAYARVNPIPEKNDEERSVKIMFYIEPGKKIYVRRIYFEGNSKTKDDVIRREIIQMESAPINTKQVEGSKTRLNRTGYFTDVKLELRPVPGVPDEVDLVYIVEEASSGQLGGGIGYSDADGFLVNANISNRNFLGTGKNLDLNFNQSSAYKTYSLSYHDPYYTFSGISRGFNAFYSKTSLGQTTNVSNYTTDAFGGNVAYGIPLSPVDKFTFGYGFQTTELKTYNQFVPTQIIDFIANNGDISREVTAAVGWVHNTFDRYIFPENGLSQSAGLTLSVPESDLQYYRLTYNMQWFHALGHGFVFTTSGTLGYGDGYGKTNGLPFYKNFFAGGARTVRGFQESSLGPKDSLGNSFGGNLLTVGNVSLIIPNFFSPETKAIRLACFFDIGQVWDTQSDLNLVGAQGLRYSTGVSATWMSPLGPLTFSVSLPLNKHDGDKVQQAALTFGTTY